jgi:hypothetical protein
MWSIPWDSQGIQGIQGCSYRKDCTLRYVEQGKEERRKGEKERQKSERIRNEKEGEGKKGGRNENTQKEGNKHRRKE